MRQPPRLKAGRLSWILGLALALCASAGIVRAQGSADQVCQRFAPGSALPVPPDVRSQNGVLEVTLNFRTAVDTQGLTRYCYVTDGGLESPTLHLSPGDQLIIHFRNDLPAAPGMPAAQSMKLHAHRAGTSPDNDCMGGAMGPAVTNLHFHGLNVAPTCHQDEVINTLVQPSETFDYAVQIPPDEPTGLYWYHPHPHGFSNGQVLGGAAGALIVEGIENVSPAVAGLPERLFVFRDQVPPAGHDPQDPWLDVSVNYVPVPAPTYTPPVIQTAPGVAEFWRALNGSSNTMLQLQYVVDGRPQPLQVIAFDGVPIGQGTGPIQSVSQTSITLPPGARAEFIATTPNSGQQARLITQAIDTGPDGPPHPQRQLVSIVAQSGTAPSVAHLAARRTSVRITRFANLNTVAVQGRRSLYFSESLQAAHAAYFITVQGQTPAEFDMSAPPNIVLHQGTTEEWTVQNRSLEDHIFHIHQMRFQTLAVDGVAVNDPALRDTITVPHWTGSGPYPSVRLLMDFRAENIVGTFVYHCHLLSHEDSGMMGGIQVLPSGVATTTTITATALETGLNMPVSFAATVTPASAGSALSGSVQFFDGDVPLGEAVELSNGRATLPTQLTSYGTHVISAAYSGDSTRNQSLSAGVNVVTEDFALSAGGLTLKQGQAGSVPVVVSTSSGFSSVMNFSCALPATLTGASCTVSPTSLTDAGTLTLSVSTNTAVAAAVARPTPVLLAGLLLLIPWYRNRRVVVAGAILGALALIIGCSSTHKADSAAPPGMYTILVTGSCANDAGPLVHTISVPLQII